MIPTPQEIFSRFERGEIEREELHAMMAVYARELIGEIEEDRQNPAGALLERLLARRLAGRLVRRHGGRLIREILGALAEVGDFPVGRYLWNAAHADVPLYCFFRMRREPVFRIKTIRAEGDAFHVQVEHGSAAKGLVKTQVFVLKRDDAWRLRVVRA